MIIKVTGIVVAGAILYGLLYFGINLTFGNEVWSDFSTNIQIFVAISAIGAIFFEFSPSDALWDALIADYPGQPISFEQGPISSGPLVSSSLDDESWAKTFADEIGLHLQPKGYDSRGRQFASIPWATITEVEIVRPDEAVLEKGLSEELVDLLNDALTAKVILDREFNPMTLAVPWNERFNKVIPKSVRVRQNWQWPNRR